MFLDIHVHFRDFKKTRADIETSDRAGISLNQWFTSYFEAFREHGH